MVTLIVNRSGSAESTRLNLTDDMLRTVRTALQSQQDFFFEEIRKAPTPQEFEMQMECYERATAAATLIDQALQPS